MRQRRRSSVQALCLLWLASAVWTAGATWCIARSGAPARSVLAGLDYACSPAGGADCAPIQPGAGLCFLPNTLAAHASYAYNSAFQRTGNCDFAGTATVTLTDPSYGSCTYPASKSAAGANTSRPPLGGNNDDSNGAPDLGPDDSGAEARTVAASFLSLALSYFVYLHLR